MSLVNGSFGCITPSTFPGEPQSPYPALTVDTTGTSVVSQAGAVLLLRTAEKTGLTTALSESLDAWRKPLAVHDPGKIVLDLAISLAIGGDCLADIAVLREELAVFGHVASDPTVSRMIDVLAKNPGKALTAINTATAHARANAWTAAGKHAPDHEISAENLLIIDLDATLVTSHLEKDQARPTSKKRFGFHPLLAFVDHGPGGTGEPVAALLGAGNAGSNTVADHVTVINDSVNQLPLASGYRVGRKVLIRTGGAGGTHGMIEHCEKRRLSYSVGFTLTEKLAALIDQVPKAGWTPAYNADRMPRDSAWVAELTHMADLSGWPKGMRLIIRKERTHPRCLVTDHRRRRAAGDRIRDQHEEGTTGGSSSLHRQRARCEDRIRNAKETGLAGFPLHEFDQNQIWVAIVALASELTTWMQMLALTGHESRRWEPKRLRLRVFSVAARVARHARRTRLRLSAHAPWSTLIAEALSRLSSLPAPS